MTASVLVFEDQASTLAVEADSSSYAYYQETPLGVLVFEDEQALQVASVESDGSFILFEAPSLAAYTDEVPGDILLLERPSETSAVLTDGTSDFVIIEPAGHPGTPGANGTDGKSAFQIAVENGFSGTEAEWLESLIGGGGGTADDIDVTFGFATPVSTWVLEHNLGTYALNVDTTDQNGDLVEGNVRKVSAYRIDVDFFYPTAGTARVFR